MFLEPLMNEIYAHEKSIGRKLTHDSEDKQKEKKALTTKKAKPSSKKSDKTKKVSKK